MPSVCPVPSSLPVIGSATKSAISIVIARLSSPFGPLCAPGAATTANERTMVRLQADLIRSLAVECRLLDAHADAGCPPPRPEAATARPRRSALERVRAKAGRLPCPLCRLRNLETLPVLPRQQRVGLLVVDEGFRLAVEAALVADSIGDVRQMRQGRGQVAVDNSAVEQLGVVGADGVDEIL